MNSWHPQCDHSKKLYKQLYDFDQQSGSVKVDASGAHIESQGKQVIYISNTQMSTPLSLDERITLLQNIVDFNWNCVGCVLDIKQRAIYWLSASECNLTERAILYLVTAYKIQKKCGGPLNEITMLLADAFVQCQPARGNNLLHHFIEYRCAPVIKYLLKQQEIQSWLQQKNSEGRLPIHIAIMTGNSEIANLLLQLSSAELLNTQDNKGNTSLHLAVKQAIKSKADREKFESVIEGLLERDVDPNIKNSKGKHAFDLAFSCTEVKEIFLPFNRPILLKQSLSEYYAKKEDLSLLIPQQAQNIPIETIYTRLAIIGEREKKEKEKEIKEAAPGQSLTQLTYETIFEPKEAITLEKLFNLDPLKEASEKRVVIQGAPGIGKSTLCHHIAYQWAKKELFNEFDYLFWLPLRRLNTKIYPSGQDSLVNYLSKECDLDQTVVEDFLNNKNLRKKTLILLDGYDELSPEATNPEEGDLYKILEHLKKFPNVLMTSRPQAISDFKRVCDLEILGFDNRGIEEYIDRFFSTESTENRELRHYLKQHPLAKSLAHIPIHLEIFCSITTAGKLPSLTEAVTITGLYTILTEWLFRRFRCERGERKEKPHSLLKNNPILAPEVRYKKKALEEIAWKGMKSDKRSIDHSSIEKTLKRINKKRSLKKELSTEDLENIGLIKPENDHVWVFNHSTFQEYFAASKLACLYLKEDTRKATFILKKIKLRPQYQLVLSMTAGLLSKEKKQNGLLLFFNDLYSEPRDLAESYESDLMATCFAECETLESLSERYDEFMCQTIANLESPIYDVKNSAVDIIGEIAKAGKELPEKAIDSLIALLSAPQTSDATKHSAVHALGEIAKAGKELPETTIDSLITLLNDLQASDETKRFAVGALGEIAKAGKELCQEALKSLITLLNDSQADYYIRRLVVNALSKIDKAGKGLLETAIDSSVNLLNDPQASYYSRHFAVDVLDKIAETEKGLPEAAINSLIALLNYPQASYNLKHNVARVLGKIAKAGKELPEAVINGLIALLNSPLRSYSPKQFAADALVEIAKAGQELCETAIDSLMNLLNDPLANGDAKGSAAFVLGEIVRAGKELPEAAINSSITLLNNVEASNDAKSSAIHALGEIAKAGKAHSEAAINGLIGLLNDPQASNNAKGFAAYALGGIAETGKVHSEAAINRLIGLLNDPLASGGVKGSVAYDLGGIAKAGKMHSEAAINGLIGLLNDPWASGDAKDSAAYALGGIAKAGIELPETAINSLIAFLKDPWASDHAKSSAARALAAIAKIGKELPEPAIGGLIALLNGRLASNSAKNSAIDALGEIATSGKELPEAAINSLIALLNDPQVSNNAKNSAIHVLGEIAKAGKAHSEAAINGLIGLLNDPLASGDAKGSAAYALSEIAKAGKVHSEAAINGLFALLNAPQTSYTTKRAVASALNEIAKAGIELPETAINSLITLLNNLWASNDAKSSAARALAAIAKTGKELPETAINSLITLLNNPWASDDAKSSAAYALGGIAKAGIELPETAINSLIALLNDPWASDDAKSSAAYALGKIAKAKIKLPETAINSLIALLNGPQASYVTRPSVSGALAAIIEARIKLSEVAINSLAVRLKGSNHFAKYLPAFLLIMVITTTKEFSKKIIKDLINLLNDPEFEEFVNRFIKEIDLNHYTIDCQEKFELLKIICRLSKRALYQSEGKYYITDQRAVVRLKRTEDFAEALLKQ